MPKFGEEENIIQLTNDPNVNYSAWNPSWIPAHSDYCVLNLCRIIYSFRERDVAVSKRFSGEWATGQFPQWKTLITAAIRSYEGGKTQADSKLLEDNVVSFLEFARGRVAAAKHELWTRNVAE